MMPSGLPASRVGLVTDRHRLCAAAARPLADGPALLAAQTSAAAAAGLAFVQVREGDLPGAVLLALTQHLLTLAAGRTRIVVNDRADVAALSGADLHCKRQSVAPHRVRDWAPPTMWVSRAVHAIDELTALEGVDLVVAGTAAPTVSKAAGTPTLGAEGLTRLVRACPVPVFAIGGLTPRDRMWLATTGVAGCAAVGAFLPRAGEDVAAAVERTVGEFAALTDANAGPNIAARGGTRPTR